MPGSEHCEGIKILEQCDHEWNACLQFVLHYFVQEAGYTVYATVYVYLAFDE
jgi:hypothetical protein